MEYQHSIVNDKKIGMIKIYNVSFKLRILAEEMNLRRLYCTTSSRERDYHNIPRLRH